MFQELLAFSGAEFDGRFVTRPGVKIIASSAFEGDMGERFGAAPGVFARSGEFKARLCYLAFPPGLVSTEDESTRYVSGMIDRGHLSVWNAFYVEFLICGVSIETMIELLAHTEAKTSRLTTSKTRAQTDTFYRVFGTPEQIGAQKEVTLRWLEAREAIKGRRDLTLEQRNMLNLGTKCGALTFSMSLKDYRRFLAGRCCVDGNETEVREVALEILKQLHARYPPLFEELAAEYLTLRGSARGPA